MKFQALELSLYAIRLLRPLMPKIRRHDTETYIQLRKSANSVVANLSEGSGRTGRDQCRFYKIGSGSARESIGHLRLSKAWGWLTDAETAEVLDVYDHIVRILKKITG